MTTDSTPSVAEIMAMQDEGQIHATIAALTVAIGHIEAQMQSGAMDHEWRYRATGALGYRRAELAAAERRLRQLKGQAGPRQAHLVRLAREKRKTETAQAHQARLAAAQDRVQAQRLATIRQLVTHLQRMDDLWAFRRSARQMLPAETYEAIETAALRDVGSRLYEMAAQLMATAESEDSTP